MRAYGSIAVLLDDRFPGYGVVRLGIAHVPIMYASSGAATDCWIAAPDGVKCFHDDAEAWAFIAAKAAEDAAWRQYEEDRQQ